MTVHKTPTLDPATGRVREKHLPGHLAASALTASYGTPKLDKTEAATTYAPRLATDPGEAFVAALDFQEPRDINVTTFAPSLGDEVIEWVYKSFSQLSADYPTRRFEYKLWSDALNTHAAPVVLSSGGTGRMFSDNFNRTVADLYLDTPDYGTKWEGFAATAGKWKTNGTHAEIIGTTGQLNANGYATGDQSLTLSGINMSTVNATGATRFIDFMIKYVDVNNFVMLRISIANTTGAVSWFIIKKIAGVQTTIATGSANPIAANTASVVFDASISNVGTAVTAIVNGVTLNATLVAGDVTALANATYFSISPFTMVGTLINAIHLDVGGSSVSPKLLTIYNNSHPGADLSYHTSKLAQMMPVTMDAAIVALSHNYGSTSGPAYVAIVETFVNLLKAAQPAIGVIASSENPQKVGSLITDPSFHSKRMQALRVHAARLGWGYIPVAEGFLMRPGGYADLINADGVHIPSAGGDYWASIVLAYFRNRSNRPA